MWKAVDAIGAEAVVKKAITKTARPQRKPALNTKKLQSTPQNTKRTWKKPDSHAVYTIFNPHQPRPNRRGTGDDEMTEQYRGFTLSFRFAGFDNIEAVVTDKRGGLILTALGIDQNTARRNAYNRIDYYLQNSNR